MRVATNRQFATQNLRHRGEDSGGEAPATLRCKLEQVMAGGQMGHGAIGAISIKIRKAVRLPVRELVLFSGGLRCGPLQPRLLPLGQRTLVLPIFLATSRPRFCRLRLCRSEWDCNRWFK